MLFVANGNFYSLNSFPNKPEFTCLQYKSFENTVRKGEIGCDEQFLLFPQLFFTGFSLENFMPFSSIQSCCLELLSVWKSLKSVVWEKVNKKKILVFHHNML